MSNKFFTKVSGFVNRRGGVAATVARTTRQIRAHGVGHVARTAYRMAATAVLAPHVARALEARAANAPQTLPTSPDVLTFLHESSPNQLDSLRRIYQGPMLTRHPEFRPRMAVPGNARSLMDCIAFYDGDVDLPGAHGSASGWSEIVRRVPRWHGEYQPHVPGDLGFYSTHHADTLARQATLARQYGVTAFCFYVPLGQKAPVLPTALRVLLDHPEIDIGLCVCLCTDLPGTQADSAEPRDVAGALAAHADWLRPVFADARCVHASGHPLVVLFDHSAERTLHGEGASVRSLCARGGAQAVHLVAAPIPSPALIETFDAVLQFAPHDYPHPEAADGATLLDPRCTGCAVEYASAATAAAQVPTSARAVYQCVATSWSASEGAGGDTLAYLKPSPVHFGSWLMQACRNAQRLGSNDRRVFVNGWNAWRQGAHLEPDEYFGMAFLEAGRRTLEAFGPKRPADWRVDPSSIAAVLHMHYPELWPEISSYLRNLPDGFGLYVTIGMDVPESVESDIKAVFPNACVLRIENRGRDVLPFLTVMKQVIADGRLYVCKIHSKKSKHRQDGETWRTDLYTKLLGSRQIIDNITFALENRPGAGLIGPQGHMVPSSYYWGANADNVARLGWAFGFDAANMSYEFAAGTMFWAKVAALRPLVDLGLNRESFDAEAGQIDGTLAHAIERAIPLAVASSGMYLIDTGWVDSEAVADSPSIGADYAWAQGTRPADY